MATENNIERAFCTTREAAKLLGVSIGTVQHWVESGVLDAWKTAGGHRRVMRDSLERLLRRGPTSTAAELTALPDPVAPVTGLTVMVVEDNAILRRLYREQLGQWPMIHQLMTYDNAFSALMAISQAHPDLLITDLSMPGLDGREMLRVLRHSPEVAHTTIVVVSGLDPQDIAAGGGVPDGIEVLAKPIPFERLRTIATDLWRQQTLAMLHRH
jgi:excisionase family DNA binding protein